MGTASARKRRRTNAVKKGSSKFYDYVSKKNYKSAATIAYWNSLKEGGEKRILTGLYDANSFIKRSAKWK